MIHNLKPYPAYKDSGVPWLGEVPEHWEVRRVKQLCRFIYGDSLPTEARQHGDIAVFGSNGRVGSHIISNTHSPCIVIGRKGSFGKVNFSADRIFAIDTTFYIDDRFTNANLRWLYYLLGCLRLDEVSNDSAVPGLHREEVYQKIVAYPADNDEQFAIAQYLDHINRLISRYIRAKKKLIKLLEEQKQAIIHQAVTRGLDPNVKLKPSGVEWLGDVPEHWEVIALKRLCSLLRDGTHLPPARQSTGIPLLSVRNIVGGRFVNRDDDSFISFSDYEQLCRSFVVQQNDVLLAIVGATLGKVAIVPAMSQFHIQRSLAVFRPKRHKLLHDYLAFFLRGPAFQRALWTTVAFSAQPGIYLSTLGAFRIAVPPLTEQKQIVLRISQHTEQVQQSIDKAYLEISLLREYRTRLIADVVTGKLDVREAAASLPEETNETEALDEELTDEEDTAEEELDREPEEE
ncbi:restriction endonuclease subunit S [Methanosarcina sp.]|jgi:type I restriction enzyme S subunit|uniref:restriction endonuclease subunit S n=1 Tax=Methanosarcina sp. TaxID=2213 RepID=UPI002B5EEA2C|nr:restriction endonuclease subunit S [Methanosarcina sp.]HOW15194.1 restriction endonuclease subunit S [Methanosarcina sp.]